LPTQRAASSFRRPRFSHQLTDQIHQRIEPAQIHPNVAAASPRPARAGGGAVRGRELPFVAGRSAEADALDVAHRPDGGFDVGRRLHRVELNREATVEIVRFEGGERRLHPVHGAQGLHLSNDQHRAPPFQGRFRPDGDVDDLPRRSRRGRRSR